MIIDCGTCVVAGLKCDECVVTVLLGSPTAVETGGEFVTHVDDEHAAALEALADSGLVPRLQLVRRHDPRTRAS